MKKYFLLLLAFFSLPSLARACAVCFGGADGNLIKGFTWGILLLLVLPFALMAGFITVIATSIKKKKAHE